MDGKKLSLTFARLLILLSKNYKLRNNVAPGITGFAQVMFRYGHDEEDATEKLMFDIYYIESWSLWLEIEIGLRTVAIIFGKKGF